MKRRVLPEPTLTLPAWAEYQAGRLWPWRYRLRITTGWLNCEQAAAAVRRHEAHGDMQMADRFRPHIKHKVRYSSFHDALACLACDVWLEPKCKCGPEDGCPFPFPRPDKPSEVV